MIININQKKISFGDKYEIYTDEVKTHRAAAKLFRLFAEINLFEGESDKPVMTIKKRFSFFAAKYDITRNDGSVFEFRTVSFWRAHYMCQYGYDQYDIYRHRGRKCSVYKNRYQEAWWDRKAVTWFDGDNYRIEANDNCDKNFIIALCLVVDNYANNDRRKGAINVNVGRIGPQAKAFNAHWRPNQ